MVHTGIKGQRMGQELLQVTRINSLVAQEMLEDFDVPDLIVFL